VGEIHQSLRFLGGKFTEFPVYGITLPSMTDTPPENPVAADLSALINSVQTQAAEVKAAVQAAAAEVKTAVEAKVDELVAAVQAKVAEIQAALAAE
jgi:hypothetical protein